MTVNDSCTGRGTRAALFAETLRKERAGRAGRHPFCPGAAPSSRSLNANEVGKVTHFMQSTTVSP